MPELPEVEVLVRHLNCVLRGQRVKKVSVRRRRVLGKTSPRNLTRALTGQTFCRVKRRGKFLVFDFVGGKQKNAPILVGHLGMTGRMYLTPRDRPLPRHAAVILNLGPQNFVFEDTRYFGKFTLDTKSLEKLGPEPLSKTFTTENLAERLSRSKQPIKIKLLDQSLVAGIGNIYASEALFRAGIPPSVPANRLTEAQIQRLWSAIRKVLSDAIRFGSTVPLKYEAPERDGRGDRRRAGSRGRRRGRERETLQGDRKDKLFYFGTAPEAADFDEERLRVYDRAGRPCGVCGTVIQRIFQGGRSTFYCAKCQQEEKCWLQR